MDRFCRILAQAGFVVVAPRLPTFLDLRLDASVVPEFQAVFDQLECLGVDPDRKPALFSISFGSLPVLRLAADPDYAGRVSAVVTFGGYVHWTDVLRFVLRGTVEVDGETTVVSRDPLNQPAVFMNLLHGMDIPAAHIGTIRAAWSDFIRATWGREEMKAVERYGPVAEGIAQTLAPTLRSIFLTGCGLTDQEAGIPRCIAIAEQDEELNAALSVSTALAGVRAPVHIFHGVDDDVIPFTQAEKLRASLRSASSVNVYVTGMVGHTSVKAGRGPTASRLRELMTMLRMLRVLASAPEQS
jgi:pimeloyl-ACP methyl ester carboxylesterase